MRQLSESTMLKYLITNEQDSLWGLTIHSVGYQKVKSREPYPPLNHPARYLFVENKGRVLEEYQLLYIVSGKGRLTSKSLHSKKLEIKQGDMFLLFPGEWHDYRPDERSGWEEYWIGFTGLNMDSRVEHKFFNKEKPAFNVGVRSDIVEIYNLAISIAHNKNAGYQQMLAGIVNMLLGYAYSYDMNSSFENMEVVNDINKAKIIIAENFHTDITPEDIAERVNMSYSWFRRIFKQYTGLAPVQYIQEIRIHKSKELLTNSPLMIKEIAFEVGFNNTEYFATLFKKRTGYTPGRYREFTQGYNL